MTQTRNTVRQIIANGGGRLRAAGIDSARVDAELLMAHCLSNCEGRGTVSRSSLFLRGGDLVSEEVSEEFHRLIERRANREPLQYIMGVAPFGGVDIAVGPGCFIPRPESELISEWAAKMLRRHLQESTTWPAPTSVVVDLCAGPGTLSLAIARAVASAINADPALALPDHLRGRGPASLVSTTHPAIVVVGVEKSTEALEYALHNRDRFFDQWKSELEAAGLDPAIAATVVVEFIPGDVTDSASAAAVQAVVNRIACGEVQATADTEPQTQVGGVDIIVSNPPYVPESTEVSPEVMADPHEAVFGGVDGMSVIDPMMETIRKLSHPGTMCAIEHDDSTADLVKQSFSSRNFSDITGHKDLAGRDRFVTARA